MIDLRGHLCVITGAGAGLGRGSALGLAEAGAELALIDVNPEGLQQTAEQIQQSTGRQARMLVADVSSATAVADVFEQITRIWPDGIDSVINVAGVEFFKDFDAVTVDEWDRQIAINLKSVFLCAQHGARLIQKRGGGSIINTASVQAFATTGRTAPYAAAKGGIVSMTRDLARDLGAAGIRVNAVCPGCIQSPMLDRSYATKQERREGLARLESVLPLRRIGQPKDFANLVNFLVSPMASYITGQAIALDGGMMCRLPLT